MGFPVDAVRLKNQGVWFFGLDHLAPILERLGIRRELWPDLVTRFDQMFGRVVGAAERVAQRAAQAGRRWYRGVTHCAAAFG